MKHPIFTNKVRLIVWWLVWIFIALGQSLLFYYAFGSFIQISLVDSLVSLVIYSGIGLSLWFPFKYINSGEIRTTALISNLVASGAISIILNPYNSAHFKPCCKRSYFYHTVGTVNQVYNDNRTPGTKQLPGILGCNIPIQSRIGSIYLWTYYSNLLSFRKP